MRPSSCGPAPPPPPVPPAGRGGTILPCADIRSARGFDRIDNLVIARAAAEVPGEGGADLLPVGFLPPGQKGDRRQHHARRTEPALDRSVLRERRLDRMRLVGGADPLDGADGPALGLGGQHEAGQPGFPIDQDGA
jgi:hypothetical protein